MGAERLRADEDKDLVTVVKREVEHHNITLATITTTLQDALVAAAVSHQHMVKVLQTSFIVYF